MAIPQPQSDYQPKESFSLEDIKNLRGSPAHRASRWLGYAFLFMGLIGVLFPDFLGAHLSPTVNLIHLTSGIVALWFGLKATTNSAKIFCWGFGVFYALLGIGGFAVGRPGVSAAGHVSEDPFLMVFIRGILEFGRNDHILHIVMGAIFIFAAILTSEKMTRKHNYYT